MAEAAASVIALIKFATGSVKSTYEIVSAIRDAPHIVRQIAASLDSLHSILLQLQKYGNTLCATDNLLHMVTTCAADIQVFRPVIRKLHESSGDSSRQKLGKRLKVMLREKDLQRIWHCIQQHFVSLSLQMSLIEK